MVSGGILFVREPIPKTKISILENIFDIFKKEIGKYLPGRGWITSNKAKDSGVI